MPHEPVVSTGRGGAGNIGTDPTVYTDGGIVREGVEGESIDGAFSTGRGGAGNVGSPKIAPSLGRRSSQDIIPETSLRPITGHENFHTGRGGEGNVYKEKYGGHSGPPRHEKHEKTHQDKESLGDKVKHLFGMDGKKRGDSPAPAS